MKKLCYVCFLFLIAVQFCNAQTELSPEEVDTYKTLAEEKAETLQIELSLTDDQTERVTAKIFKYSVIAKDLLQSDIDRHDKTRQLYSIAAEQKEEIRLILTEDQYNYYKRRNGTISARR